MWLVKSLLISREGRDETKPDLTAGSHESSCFFRAKLQEIDQMQVF